MINKSALQYWEKSDLSDWIIRDENGELKIEENISEIKSNSVMSERGQNCYLTITNKKTVPDLKTRFFGRNNWLRLHYVSPNPRNIESPPSGFCNVGFFFFKRSAKKFAKEIFADLDNVLKRTNPWLDRKIRENLIREQKEW